MVGLENAYLARLGLRDANDSRMRDTLTVVKALIEVETPAGPGFYRYNHDGYGEHEDGPPYDGTGVGRLWPLLTGERGHLALLQGEDPTPYLNAMMKMTGACGLLPEQVWDRDPLPDRGLFPGRPTGSAMPLVWAHAEYIKLLVSRQLGHPYDRPPATWQRYQGMRPEIQRAIWLPQSPIQEINAGQTLLVAMFEPGSLHWGIDGWQSSQDRATQDTGLGLHVVEFETKTLQAGQRIDFTFQRVDTGEWSGRNYTIVVTQA